MQDIEIDGTWFDDNVENYVDGELSDTDRLQFLKQLNVDAHLRQSVQIASQIQDSFGQLSRVEVPAEVLDNVHRTISSESARISNRFNIHRMALSAVQTTSTRNRRIVMSSMAAAASLLLLFLLSNPANNSISNDQPTQAEVDEALIEVKRTLALVSEMGYERSDIVNGHVVDPVQKAMSFIFLTGNSTEVQ